MAKMRKSGVYRRKCHMRPPLLLKIAGYPFFVGEVDFRISPGEIFFQLTLNFVFSFASRNFSFLPAWTAERAFHTAHFVWFRLGLIRGNWASRMKLCALFSRYSCVNFHVCELALPFWNKMKYLSWWKRWQSGVLIVAGNSRYSLEIWPSHILSVRFIFEAVEKLLKIFVWNFAQIFERHLSIHVANFRSLSCIHHTLLTT